MYTLEFDENSLLGILQKNIPVLLNIYEKDEILSELMSAAMVNVQKNIDERIMVGSIRRDKFQNVLDKYELCGNIEVKRFPVIWFIKNGIILDRMEGFCRVGKIVDFVRKVA